MKSFMNIKFAASSVATEMKDISAAYLRTKLLALKNDGVKKTNHENHRPVIL